MTIASAVIALLKLALSLVGFARERNLISAGEDRAIAAALAENLRKTDAAKATMEQIYAMSESQVDDLLRSLEPKP